MGKKEIEIREEIIATCIKMNDSGLNQGTSGNISVRTGNEMLITPTGMSYQKLVPKDIVKMSIDTGEILSERKPSSEWRFHRDILKAKPDVDVVLHNHSLYATSVAMARMDIPACHYMVAISGGNSILCADYATFGTPELSENIIRVLENRTCCLLANHGVITTGKSLEKAFGLAVEVENLAAQLIFAKQLGSLNVLDDAEMSKVLEKFKSYGKQPTKAE